MSFALYPKHLQASSSQNFKQLPKNMEYNATFGGLLLMIGDFVRYLFSKWKLILFCAALGGVIGFWKATTSTTSYKSKLTFMVNEEDSPSGGIENILGSLGVSSGNTSQHNLPKILELASSMRIIQNVLLRKETINGAEDFFANHFINAENFHTKWTGDKKNLLFQNDQIANFNLIENEVLKILYHQIVGTEKKDGIFSKSLSNDSRIMTLSLETSWEDLSVKMLQTIFDELSLYYVEKTIEKQYATFEAIQSETDSIKKELKSAEYQLAQFRDTRQGLINQRSQLRKNDLQRKVLLFSTIYGESVKNLELAKFNLKQKTPFIQAIDLPFKPLSPIHPSLPKYVIIGVIVGGLLIKVILLCYKIVQEAIAAEKRNQ